MSIDFNQQNFAYPLSIIKLHSRFEKTQWFSEPQLEALQIFVGSEMHISIEYTTLEDIRGPGTKKFKVVSSHVKKAT